MALPMRMPSQIVASINEVVPRNTLDIPYFPHQQLNPNHFPGALSLPVAPPPGCQRHCNSKNHINRDCEGAEIVLNGWSDDDDEEVSTPAKTQTKRSSSSTSKHNSTSYKRVKMAGGRPAVPKKVTADLDSDDQLIVRMKNAKYLEKNIAAELVRQGRINYHPKTIGTRWIRLKQVLRDKEDALLDEELTDWHEGDDDVLHQAIEKADREVAKAKAELDVKKWQLVAENMKTLKPVTNFSKNACRNRSDALQAGIAKPCPESITNPSAKVLESINRRKKDEQRLEKDRNARDAKQENRSGNAWSSRSAQRRL